MLGLKVSIFILIALAVSRACVAQGDKPCFDPSLRRGDVVTLSAAKKCYGNVVLDPQRTIQGITSLLDTFEHLYAFYNYAVDAPDSAPLKNPENWMIYNGTGGGQVNLSQRKDELINQVEKNGATLMTVMDLATTIAAPLDRHIGSILSFMNNGVFGSGFMMILDETEFSAGKPIPGRYLTLDEIDGTVSVAFKSNDTEKVLKVIDTIDGVSALQYLERFVSLPGICTFGPYKALGSRMQFFLQQALSDAPKIAALDRVANVFDSLPDSVDVKYQDGSSATWLYVLAPGSDKDGGGFIDYTLEELTAYANTEPENSPYTTFMNALKQAGEVRSIPDYPEAPSTSTSRGTPSDIGSITQSPATPMNWTFFLGMDQDENDDGPDVLFAITTVEDATVLKFEGFDLNSASIPDSMTLCKYLYDYAEKNGNTKLIIDLTDNGGGNVDQTFAMTQCLYPQATYNQLMLPYQLRWSAFRNQQLVLERETTTQTNDIASNGADVKVISEILSADIPGSLIVLKRMRNTLKGMQELNVGVDYSRDIMSISLMIDEVTRSNHFRSSFVKVLLQMPDFSKSLVGVPSYIGNQLNGDQQEEQVIQSGIPTNILTNWTRFQPNYYVQAENALKGLNNPYQAYGIIGNGLGGSSSSTFEMNVIETSQLNPTWTPAKTFSYGCVGNKDSCPVNQFQGGTIGKGSYFNSITYLSAGWFAFMGEFFGQIAEAGKDTIPTSILDDIQAYRNDVDDFLAQVPAPPALATSDFYTFQFTVYSALSKLTGFDSIPAEYFATPPTEYIPFWPNWSKTGKGTSSYASSTLLPLYQTVAGKI